MYRFKGLIKTVIALILVLIFSSSPTLAKKSKKIRSYDGSKNNLKHPDWGQAKKKLQRMASLNYQDRVSSIAENLPNARSISNEIFQQKTLNQKTKLSNLFWQWGQFLDHDIDLSKEMQPKEAMDIPVPLGDAFFDPNNTGNIVIPFSRSEYAIYQSTTKLLPRQQMNSISSYIDASNVYGSDRDRALALRSLEQGKLKTSSNNFLPFNIEGLENAPSSSSIFRLAGDIRANEAPGLTVLHTIFMREHNRIADEIYQKHPKWKDEKIYQKARAKLIAIIQSITYNEFLPILLGENLEKYESYNKRIKANISNIFSTAAFRFGHSCVNSKTLMLSEEGENFRTLSLKESFFNPNIVNNEENLTGIIRGQAKTQMNDIDLEIIDDLRNFLFGRPGQGGLDLAALNIQRGRDHGLADYNQARKDFSLKVFSSFAEISSDKELTDKLSKLYSGNINSVDVWLGMLAEDKYKNAQVGELMYTVIKDQFTRLRDGDRFWYQRIYKGKELEEIENTKLADVIKRNTDIMDLDQVFFIDQS